MTARPLPCEGATVTVRPAAPATSTPDRPDADGDVPTVLFLCVHNAGRSQMAAGFLQHLGGEGVRVLSGGTEPADEVNPAAVAAMAEVGVDISAGRPRRWRDEDVEATDVVVTMGCGDTCPVLPGTRYLDWPLADPAGQGVDAVRPIRDDIEVRVRDLMAELGVAVRER
jgi:arsenate reductase